MGRALHRQWIGPHRHREDELKGIAPFSFQISHGLLPENHLAVLILDLELAIPRNVGELFKMPSSLSAP